MACEFFNRHPWIALIMVCIGADAIVKAVYILRNGRRIPDFQFTVQSDKCEEERDKHGF